MISAPSREVEMLQAGETVWLPEMLARTAGFVGMDPWLGFVKSVYNFPAFRIISRMNNEIDGYLALVRVRHFVFGDYLTTAPFASYGGFSFSSLSARNALLSRAKSLADSLDVEYVNVRFTETDETPPQGWISHPVYATFLLDLAKDSDKLLGTFSSDHRNHIRKSLKKGFQTRFGHLELLEHAYQGLARSMHELGSPYHGKSYLLEMARALKGELEFAVLYDPRGKIAGAGVFILQGERVTNLHANILHRFRSDYAGELLYWSAIERYGQKGLRVFDLGRSLLDSGNQMFKMKWKPRQQSLSYWYALQPGRHLPGLNQKNPKFRIAIWTWKHMPSFIVRILGPSLIRGIA